MNFTLVNLEHGGCVVLDHEAGLVVQFNAEFLSADGWQPGGLAPGHGLVPGAPLMLRVAGWDYELPAVVNTVSSTDEPRFVRDALYQSRQLHTYRFVGVRLLDGSSGLFDQAARTAVWVEADGRSTGWLPGSVENPDYLPLGGPTAFVLAGIRYVLAPAVDVAYASCLPVPAHRLVQAA